MKPKIVFITDDVLFSGLFITLLERKFPEIEIKLCGNSLEIDGCVDKNTTDLIIVDGGLNYSSSIEVIQNLRMTKKTNNPIWFFPEIKTEEYIHKAIMVGANKIVQKPFDPYQVIDDISTLLSK